MNQIQADKTKTEEATNEAVKDMNKIEYGKLKTYKNDKNDMPRYKMNKNQEVKNTGKLTPNLRSSLKNKNKNKKTVEPMVANLKKITEFMKPKPDRNIPIEDLKNKEPDTANKGSSEIKFSSLSYNRISGGRKPSEYLENTEQTLNLPRGASKADL